MTTLLRLIALAAVLLVTTACRHNAFQIEGTATGMAEGDTLLLTDDLLGYTPTDTVVITENTFRLKGRTDSARLCMIYAAANTGVQALFFLEPGKIEVSLDADGPSRVGGTEGNIAWQQLTDGLAEYERKVDAVVESFYEDDMSEESMRAKTDYLRRIDDQKAEWLRQFAESNAGNATGRFLREQCDEF